MDWVSDLLAVWLMGVAPPACFTPLAYLTARARAEARRLHSQT